MEQNLCDEFASMCNEADIMRELHAAELEAVSTTERYAHEDVMAAIRLELERIKDV